MTSILLVSVQPGNKRKRNTNNNNKINQGHSAGGHLLMAALPRLSTMRGIRKVFCISGLYSLRDIAHTTVGVRINLDEDQVGRNELPDWKVCLARKVSPVILACG